MARPLYPVSGCPGEAPYVFVSRWGGCGRSFFVPIAGDRPETGVRIVIERDKSLRDAPWTYRGAAYLPDAGFPLQVTVTAEGDVTVDLDGPGGSAAAAP